MADGSLMHHGVCFRTHDDGQFSHGEGKKNVTDTTPAPAIEGDEKRNPQIGKSQSRNSENPSENEKLHPIGAKIAGEMCRKKNRVKRMSCLYFPTFGFL